MVGGKKKEETNTVNGTGGKEVLWVGTNSEREGGERRILGKWGGGSSRIEEREKAFLKRMDEGKNGE